MREVITTALDVLGLLLVAAGLAAFLWVWIGAIALAPAGVLILGAVRWASQPEPVATPEKRVHW